MEEEDKPSSFLLPLFGKEQYHCNQPNCNRKYKTKKQYVNHMLKEHPNMLREADIYFDKAGLLTKISDIYDSSKTSDITFFSFMENDRADELEAEAKDDSEIARKLVKTGEAEHVELLREWTDCRKETKRMIGLYREYSKLLDEAVSKKKTFILKNRFQADKLEYLKDERLYLIKKGVPDFIVDSIPDETLLKDTRYDHEPSSSSSDDESDDESEEEEIIKKPYVPKTKKETIVKKPYVPKKKEEKEEEELEKELNALITKDEN